MLSAIPPLKHARSSLITHSEKETKTPPEDESIDCDSAESGVILERGTLGGVASVSSWLLASSVSSCTEV